MPALWLVAFLAGACDDDGEGEAFQFTPVPYTVMPSSTAVIGVQDDGDYYFADEVFVTLEQDERDDFVAWAEGVGFSAVIVEPALDLPLIVTVKVPAGSVPAAISLIAEQDGVVTADYNLLLDLEERDR
jgi:hypothetical protein